MASLTAPQRRALEILRDNPGITPRGFSEKMWPDSEGHRRLGSCGPNGVTRGIGMWKAGGSYLGKLGKQGWVRYRGFHNGGGHELTKEGRRALAGTGAASLLPLGPGAL